MSGYFCLYDPPVPPGGKLRTSFRVPSNLNDGNATVLTLSVTLKGLTYLGFNFPLLPKRTTPFQGNVLAWIRAFDWYDSSRWFHGIINDQSAWALKKACNRISFLEIPTREVGLKNPYLICDYCGGSHEVDECEQNNPSEQICLSGGDIYNDPSLLRFYQNDDTSPRGNSKCKEKGDDGSEWIIRSKFEDELAKFMLEKKSQAKGIEDMLV
ncbi:hypothetical protein Tco_0006643 [Tanacetum coccineum]